MITPLELLLGLVPVVLFLAGLRLLDSFKLVSRRAVLLSIAAGAVASLLSYVLNAFALNVAHADPVLLRRYLAPAIEETLKGCIVLALVWTNRVGFAVDAGIHGFAVGAGFALVENLYYAWALGQFDPGTWIVRGLGTAMLHGSTTAVVGIIAKDLTDRHRSKALRFLLPGLALAFVVHSLYNHLLLNPLLATALLIVMMPIFVVIVFERSERATHDWLGVGLDGDAERLEQILGGELRGTPIGDYLESLRTRFPGIVLADMLSLLRIHLELSLRAKGVLIARAAGVELPPDPRVRADLDELRHLEHAIGPTGRLAVQPLLGASDRDLWQMSLLRK